MNVSKKELAKLLGVSIKGAQYYLDSTDLPDGVKVGSGNKMLYDLAVFLPYYVDRKVTSQLSNLAASSQNIDDGIPGEDTSKALKAHYEAQKIGLEVERIRGNTITVAEALDDLNARLTRIKQVLDSIPFKWANFLIGVDNVGQMQVRLHEQTNLLIQRLQNMEADEDDEDDTEPSE